MNEAGGKGNSGSPKGHSVAFADKDLYEAFLRLEKEDKELYKAISHAIDTLKRNPLFGIRIPKKLIPVRYVEKYGINNLRKYNLPKGWRMLYFLKGSQLSLISIVLEWLPHKKYERRFGY